MPLLTEIRTYIVLKNSYNVIDMYVLETPHGGSRGKESIITLVLDLSLLYFFFNLFSQETVSCVRAKSSLG